MQTRSGFSTKFAFFLWVLCILSLARAQQRPQEQKAKQILEATGVKGGLVVHIGCGNGRLTAALRANDSYLVHGLDADAANIEKAREYIGSLNMYGNVSVEHWTDDRLPYIDNLANLIVSEDLGRISMDEVMRVLAPKGAAYIKNGDTWTKTVKPRPKEIDEWTHFLYDATGNAVAKDTIAGPPRHMQWTAAPTWTRNHHKLASISAVVSAQGRVFYIMDESSAASMEVPGKWFLVARDAFNGVLLWKRPMASWAYHLKGFRSGPVQLPRTLVAAADRVYAPLGMSAPVTALDVATGQTIRTYQSTEGAEEIILHDDILLVVTGSPAAEQAAVDPAWRGKAKYPNEKTIVAVQADTGKELWKWSLVSAKASAVAGKPVSENPVPLTLAAEGRRVFFQAGKGVVCLDCNTGKELWRSSPAGADRTSRKTVDDQKQKSGRKKKSFLTRNVGWSVATLVVYDGVVLSADGKRLSALSAATGKALWDCPCQPGLCRSPVDVLVAGGLVWLGPDFAEGRDLRTGQIKNINDTLADLWTAGHHHRCYREKATDRYIMTGKRGIEFLDLRSDNHSRNNWIRGVCQYGIMPCNGLIYAPSHACGCFMEAKLYGFWALAPESAARNVPRRVSAADRLERGPAYTEDRRQKTEDRSADDWPTYRHDAARSGFTKAAVPINLKRAWQRDLGGRLSAVVIAENKAFVASVDTHTVHALDAGSGKTLWSYATSGRVDSPPTVYQGRALFGSADGWVYCLRASDGELVWRFRAAPKELKTVALGQVESVWPVHGNVLVQDGVAYAAAGRSSYLDGGIFLYGLDPATGRIVCQGRVRSSHPKTDVAAPGEKGPETAITKIVQNATDDKTFTASDRSDAFSMEGATTDILVGDGTSIYMRHLRFDRKCVRQQKQSRHLFSTSGLLDDAEVHRSHWVLGTGDFSRMPVAYSWIAYNPDRYGWRLSVPYGLILTFDDETVWGVHRTKSYGYRLFADENTPSSPDEPFLPDFRRASEENALNPTWSVDLPMRPRAMLRAGKGLFLGGMPCEIDEKDPFAAYEGRKGGLLWAVSPADGSKISECKLKAPPVWDGMAAANGRLYISTEDGGVLCFGPKQ